MELFVLGNLITEFFAAEYEFQRFHGIVSITGSMKMAKINYDVKSIS